MVAHLGSEAVVVKNPEDLQFVNVIILPGVGHFRKGISVLRENGWINSLECARERGCWILGICLGMQMLMKYSEEGQCDGMGWFDLDVKRIPSIKNGNNNRRVPHMGWNEVEYKHDGVEGGQRFYFIHSYYVEGIKSPDCWAVTEYDGLRFASAVRRGRIVGVQFHPEKSHSHGKVFLRNFLKIAK